MNYRNKYLSATNRSFVTGDYHDSSHIRDLALQEEVYETLHSVVTNTSRVHHWIILPYNWDISFMEGLPFVIVEKCAGKIGMYHGKRITDSKWKMVCRNQNDIEDEIWKVIKSDKLRESIFYKQVTPIDYTLCQYSQYGYIYDQGLTRDNFEIVAEYEDGFFRAIFKVSCYLVKRI